MVILGNNEDRLGIYILNVSKCGYTWKHDEDRCIYLLSVL